MPGCTRRGGIQLTPHNEALKGDYAEVVLLPGDPERAEWIAETFLDAPRCINRRRGALGFSGHYRGVRVSVQTTGIGRPSFAIYVHELLAVYGVRTVIRVGTCGGLDAQVGLRDVVIAQSARMDFEVAAGIASREPDPVLFARTAARARDNDIAHHVGPMVSSDTFYHPDPFGRFALALRHGAIACDMETSALFDLAGQFGARALSVCTVVDSLVSGEEVEFSERQAVFTNMTRLVLDVIADMHEA